MKKIFASIALVGALGVGGVLVAGSFNEEEEKTGSTSEVVSTENITVENNEKSTNLEVPTERTVELAAGAEYPWQGAFSNEIKNWIEQDETVYLMSDLPAFEEAIYGMIDIDIMQNEADPVKVKESINIVVQQLSQYGTEEYFNKLSEVGELIGAMNYDEAKAEIEEAKQIRTQE